MYLYKRSTDIPTWLDLLDRFHQKGIHFVNVADSEGTKDGGRKKKAQLWEKDASYWDDDNFGKVFHEQDGTVSISH